MDIRCSLINYFISGRVTRRNREGLKLLRPFIAARRDERRDENFVRRFLSIWLASSPSPEQNDFLTWLIDKSKADDREDWPITARMFNVNLAAIHTSSMVSLPTNHEVKMGSFVIQAITHALLDLATNPEYLKPLREEVDEVTKREGWTESALEQMHRIDSFVKESQRLHPVGVCELFLFLFLQQFPLIPTWLF